MARYCVAVNNFELSFRDVPAIHVIVSTAVGYTDIDCPMKDNTAGNECIVANSAFMNVGIAPITADDDLGAFAGFIWVQGMDEHGDSSNASRRVFETGFLLGTPAIFLRPERLARHYSTASLGSAWMPTVPVRLSRETA